MSDAPTPDLIDPIIAYRACGLNARNPGRILSLNGHVWEPYERLEALCRFAQDRPRSCLALGADCRSKPHACGIYAWNTVTPDLVEWLAHGTPLFRNHNDVVAVRVKLWGVVAKHQHGYRAEYAYPDVVVIQGSAHSEYDRRLASVLSDAYGVETRLVAAAPTARILARALGPNATILDERDEPKPKTTKTFPTTATTAASLANWAAPWNATVSATTAPAFASGGYISAASGNPFASPAQAAPPNTPKPTADQITEALARVNNALEKTAQRLADAQQQQTEAASRIVSEALLQRRDALLDAIQQALKKPKP